MTHFDGSSAAFFGYWLKTGQLYQSSFAVFPSGILRGFGAGSAWSSSADNNVKNCRASSGGLRLEPSVVVRGADDHRRALFLRIALLVEVTVELIEKGGSSAFGVDPVIPDTASH